MRSKILLSLFSLLMLTTNMEAQFNQNFDTLDVAPEAKIDKDHKINHRYHESHYRGDDKLFDSNTDQITVSDATRTMQSQTAGLIVNANSFTPGASTSSILRGYRSLLGNNEPLIILDGMPIDNSQWGKFSGGTDQSNRLIDLNSNDIESIEVIKSGAGRAKYGIVGANGVISITSKRGKSQKPIISVRSMLSLDQVSTLPALQNKYAQGRQSNGERVYRGPETGEGFSWGPELSTLEYDGSDYDFDSNGRLVAQGTGNGIPANSYDPTEFFQSALSNNISANISGQHNNLNYFASAAYNNQQGIIPKNQLVRYNFFTSLDYKVNDKLGISANAAINKTDTQRSQRGSNLSGIMLGLLRTAPSFDNSNMSSDPSNDLSAYELENGFQRSYRMGVYDNPYWSINKNLHNDNVTRSILNLKANYRLLDNLELVTSYGRDQFSDKRNGGIDINPGRSVGSAFESTNDFTSQNLEVSLQHVSEVYSGLILHTSFATIYNSISRSLDTRTANALILPNDVSLSNGTNLNSTSDVIDRKRFGAMLAFDAAYNDFIFVDASIRQDQSNKFGKSTNGFLSYGIGIGVKLIQNNSLESNVSNILLHGSFGRFGNDFSIGNTFSTFSPDNSISGDGFISANTTNSPQLINTGVNNNLIAESTAAIDMGIDLLFNDEKYKLGFLVYRESSTGLIVNKETASTSGIQSIFDNIGETENVGFEIAINAKIVDSKKYDWNLSLAFNKNNNIVIGTTENNNPIIQSGFSLTRTEAIVDEAYGVIVGTGFLRNENQQIVIDFDGFPLSENDLIIGDPNPDWTMYINNQFTLFDKLSISANVDIKSGGDVWCGTCGVLDYFGRSEQAASEVGQTVLFEGVNTVGGVNNIEAELAPASGDNNRFYRQRYGFGGLSSLSIYDASWVRLRNIAINYNFKDVLKSDLFSNFSLGVFANNLLVITDFPGIDPETNLLGNANSRGLEYFNNPGTKQIGLVLDVSF